MLYPAVLIIEPDLLKTYGLPKVKALDSALKQPVMKSDTLYLVRQVVAYLNLPCASLLFIYSRGKSKNVDLRYNEGRRSLLAKGGRFAKSRYSPLSSAKITMFKF
jgi:hypothetical protein